MRRESERLRQHALSLEESLEELAGWTGADGDSARAAFAATVRMLGTTADDLDEAGAALQSYATDLAQGHELGRSAELRVQRAGLLMDGTRVVEPWGPASAKEAERRRAQLPVVQARVDVATSCVGRARSRLRAEMTRLSQAFWEHSQAVDPARVTPRPPR